MLHPDFILLYAADPLASAAFYEKLFGIKAVESAPTFVMFVLSSGLKLGLWLRQDVEPKAVATAGASELCVSQESDQAVHDLYASWKNLGVPMAQNPTKLDFGLTFVALDPDGHRLRVFAPGE